MMHVRTMKTLETTWLFIRPFTMADRDDTYALLDFDRGKEGRNE